MSDQMREENELICEKLLGWRSLKVDHDARLWCVPPTRGFTQPTPSFTTWAEAGLILDALKKQGARTALFDHGSCWESEIIDHDNIGLYDTGPLAIRAAALEYIREKLK